MQILAVEHFGHAGQEYNRELQTLGLVDRHNPDAASLLAAASGHPQIPAVLSQP